MLDTKETIDKIKELQIELKVKDLKIESLENTIKDLLRKLTGIQYEFHKSFDNDLPQKSGDYFCYDIYEKRYFVGTFDKDTNRWCFKYPSYPLWSELPAIDDALKSDPYDSVLMKLIQGENNE